MSTVMRFALTSVISLLLAGCFGTLTEGGGGGGSGTPDGGVDAMAMPDARVVDVKAILKAWTGCMTLTNFQAANMATAWSNLLTNDGKQCINCHDQGQYNFIATNNEIVFFSNLSQHSYFLVKYFSVDTVAEKVIVNTLSFKAANNAIGHPKFAVDTNAGMVALLNFYTATVTNTACEAPKMVD